MYESKILIGDPGSVNNDLNKLLKTIGDVISITQSFTFKQHSNELLIILTIVFVPIKKLDT